MGSRLVYRPDLDGLRALAVVPVVLFHLDTNILTGGFVGVDVFFVLSGFLITGLLAADLERGSFSLAGFYDRRIRRIVPALALVLSFCTVAALLILFPRDLTRFGSTLAATALSVSNFVFARRAGYFAPNADMDPLLHTWSLAVEEQFYILFPLLLWAAWRWGRKWLPVLIWSALLLSLVLSVRGVWIKPTAAFYLLPTRAWELLVGSVLALGLLPKPSAAWQREVGAAVGVLAIIAAMAFYSRDVRFPGLAALVPCVGAALVIWAGIGCQGSQTLTARLLATSVLVFIGLISYSLYLWHWPLIVFAKQLTNDRLTHSLQLLLAFAAGGSAALTWYFVERPLRAGGWPWPAPRNRFWGASFVLVAFVLAAGGIRLAHGLPQRFSPLVRELAAKSYDFSKVRARCHADGGAKATFAGTCVLGDSVPPTVVVFADSHGAELSVALGELAKERHSSVREVTASACPPAVGFVSSKRPACAKHVDAMLRALSKLPPTTVVMAAFYFESLAGHDNGQFLEGFEKTVRSLRNAGHSVIVLGAVPPHPGGIAVPLAVARWASLGGAPEDYRFALDRRIAAGVQHYLRYVADKTGAVYLPLVPYFCPDGRECQGYRNGTMMYFDDNHMSVSGARQVAADILAPVIWPSHVPR